MKFPNKSKSLLPISRETLLRLCKTFDKDPQGLTDHGKLTEQNYPLYVREITMFDPCPICNGPRGIVELSAARMIKVCWARRFRKYKTKTVFSPVRCLRFPVHSVILAASDPHSNWVRVTESLCEHGLYCVECRKCMPVPRKEVTDEQFALV